MNSNTILKSMISNMHGWKELKREFVERLKVDVQNCNPILNCKYDPKTMKNNLFIFLNEDNRINGILIGSTLCKPFSKYYTNNKYPLNRKNLESNSENVLMFTNEMREFFGLKSLRYSSNSTKCKKLSERLTEYKINKFNNISKDDMVNMYQQMLVKLSQNIFNMDFVKRLEKINHYDRTMLENITTITKLMDNYLNNEEKTNTDDIFDNKYYRKVSNEYKIKIIEINKLVSNY